MNCVNFQDGLVVVAHDNCLRRLTGHNATIALSDFHELPAIKDKVTNLIRPLLMLFYTPAFANGFLHKALFRIRIHMRLDPYKIGQLDPDLGASVSRQKILKSSKQMLNLIPICNPGTSKPAKRTFLDPDPVKNLSF